MKTFNLFTLLKKKLDLCHQKNKIRFGTLACDVNVASRNLTLGNITLGKDLYSPKHSNSI